MSCTLKNTFKNIANETNRQLDDNGNIFIPRKRNTKISSTIVERI